MVVTASRRSQRALHAISIVIYQQLHPNLLKNALFAEGLVWNVEKLQEIEEKIQKCHGKLWKERLIENRYTTNTFGKEEHLRSIETSIHKILQQIGQSFIRNGYKFLQFDGQTTPPIDTTMTASDDWNPSLNNSIAQARNPHHIKTTRDEKKTMSDSGRSPDMRSAPQQTADPHNFCYYQEFNLLYRLLDTHTILCQYWLMIVAFNQRRKLQDIFYDVALSSSKTRGHNPPYHNHPRTPDSYTPSQVALYQVHYIDTVGNFLTKVFVAFKLVDSLVLAIERPFIGQLAACSGTWDEMRPVVFLRLSQSNPQILQDVKLELEMLLQNVVKVLLQKPRSKKAQQGSSMWCHESLPDDPPFEQRYLKFSGYILHRIIPFFRFKFFPYFAKALGLNAQNKSAWVKLLILGGNILLLAELSHPVSSSLRQWFFTEAEASSGPSKGIYRSAIKFCKMEFILKKCYEEYQNMEFLRAIPVDDFAACKKNQSLDTIKWVDLHAMIQSPFEIFAEFNLIVVEIICESIGGNPSNRNNLHVATNVMISMTEAVTHLHKLLILIMFKENAVASKDRYNDSPLDQFQQTTPTQYVLQESMSNHYRLLVATIKQSILLWEWMFLEPSSLTKDNCEYCLQQISASQIYFSDAKNAAYGLLHTIPNSALGEENNETRDVHHLNEIHQHYLKLKKNFTANLMKGNTQTGKLLERAHRITADDLDLNNPLTFHIEECLPQNDDCFDFDYWYL
jgi:hypothetical protein